MAPTAGTWRRDLTLVLLLLAAGTAVKTWLLTHTAVLARDGITFIEYAHELDRQPWSEVLRQNHQHPLYPLSILATAQLLRTFQGELDCLAWQFSAQFPNLLAGVLLAIPMYLLGKELFDRRVGFWAALLYQVMPVAARSTADALSEGGYLLWSALALLFAVWGLRSRSPKWFALCGLAGGLAFLTRPEGAVVILVTGLVLFLCQLRPAWRAGWGNAVGCTVCLGLAATLVAAPYCLTTGRITGKPSAQEVFQAAAGSLWHGLETMPQHAGKSLFALRFYKGTEQAQKGERGTWASLKEVLDEVSKGFNYVLWIPALFGVVWFRRRWLACPALASVFLLGFVYLLVLWRLATTAQYVSERHTLVLVLCGTIIAVAVAFEIVRGPWSVVKWHRRDACGTGQTNSWRAGIFSWLLRQPSTDNEQRTTNNGQRTSSLILLYAVLATFLLGSLIHTLKPLHGQMACHREAGAWLAERFQPDDYLDDPYGWVSFYANQAFTPPKRFGPHMRRYVVVEPRDKDPTRLQLIAKAGKGHAVYQSPADSGTQLVLYVLPKRK